MVVFSATFCFIREFSQNSDFAIKALKSSSDYLCSSVFFSTLKSEMLPDLQLEGARLMVSLQL